MTDEPPEDVVRKTRRAVAAAAQEVEIHWREARDHHGEASTGSAEAARLREEMQALREEYVRLIEEARRLGGGAGLPMLPSIPGDAEPGSLRQVLD
jgi:hypothetical protein